jgi:hypothetical protein
MDALTEVGVPCRHPGTPHERHTVYLRPHIGLEGGLAAEAVLVDVNRLLPADPDKVPDSDPIWAQRAAEIMRRWLPIFIRHGAVGWDLDEPFEVEAILADFGLARPVAEAASDRYTDEVMAPFQAAPAMTSSPGPTGASTSPAPTSIQTRRRRSSPATTAASRP